MWNAYYAQADTLEGALLLGSIAIGAVQDKPRPKKIFLDLMRSIVTDILENKLGTPTVVWEGPHAVHGG